MESPENDWRFDVFRLIKLRDLCRKFITDNKITCYSDIWTALSTDSADMVGFIDSICKHIGYYGQER